MHPDKALFFTEDRILLISDLHLGKAQHFRKHGVPIPLGVADKNFSRLQALCDLFEPDRIIFLGDLFHSEANHSIERFGGFRQNNPQPCQLVMGNHDFYDQQTYDLLELECIPQIEYRNMLLVHDAAEINKDESRHIVSGHVHPAVRLKSSSRNSLRLAAFIFGESHSYIPAFGDFTGMHVMKTKDTDRVFAIAQDQVVAL